MSILSIILIVFPAILRDPTQLALENLALCKQLTVLKRGILFQNTSARPPFGPIHPHHGTPAHEEGMPLRGGRNSWEGQASRRPTAHRIRHLQGLLALHRARIDFSRRTGNLQGICSRCIERLREGGGYSLLREKF